MHSIEFRNTITTILAASVLLWAGITDRHFVTDGASQSGKPSHVENIFEIAAVAGPINLGTGPTRLLLAPTNGAPQGEPTLASRLRALPPERRVYLVFRNLNAAEQPGVLYHVYLDLPAGVKPGKNDPHLVGSLNFFQAGRLTESGTQLADTSAFRSLDITAVGKALQSRGLLSDPTAITIIPGAPPSTNAQPTIGRIQLLEQ